MSVKNSTNCKCHKVQWSMYLKLVDISNIQVLKYLQISCNAPLLWILCLPHIMLQFQYQ